MCDIKVIMAELTLIKSFTSSPFSFSLSLGPLQIHPLVAASHPQAQGSPPAQAQANQFLEALLPGPLIPLGFVFVFVFVFVSVPAYHSWQYLLSPIPISPEQPPPLSPSFLPWNRDNPNLIV